MPTHTPSEIEQKAIDLLVSRGYTVMRTGSHRRLHERVRIAEALQLQGQAEIDATRRWAEKSVEDAITLRERVNDLVEFAFRHGATVEDLADFNEQLRVRRGEPPVIRGAQTN